MSNGKVSYHFKIENIGPHSGKKKIDQTIAGCGNKIVIYSNNGVGKTAISRMFAYNGVKNVKNILSTGAKSGEFIFERCSSADNLCLNLNIETEIGVKDTTTDHLFHVFNSDYILDNVHPKRFVKDKPEGFVLVGKSKIDIDELTEKKNSKINEQTICRTQIEAAIKSAKDGLIEIGVRPNTDEFRQINFESIIIQQLEKDASYNYSVMENDYSKFLAKNILPIEKLKTPILNLPRDYEISLVKQVSSSNIQLDFIEEFRANVTFFSEGVRIHEEHGIENICPFCRQVLNDYADELVEKYNAFFKDEESSFRKKLGEVRKDIDDLEVTVKESIEDFEKKHLLFEVDKSFFTKCREKNISWNPIKEEYIQLIQEFRNNVDKKEKEVSIPILENENVRQWEVASKRLFDAIVELNSFIDIFNVANSKRKEEELELRRDLCIAKSYEIISSNKKLIRKFNELTEEIEGINEEIIEKQNQEKISKKELVANTISSLISEFFGDKYLFDKESYKISFQGRTNLDPKYHFSDGEKSIIALCFYFASIHEIIEKINDYGSIFFVIDDPISSVDSTYMFIIADLIKSLGDRIYSQTGYRGEVHCMIFTHNLEFLKMLMNNRAVDDCIYLTPGKMKKLSNELLLPYESHLCDIVAVAEGLSAPSHTTCNSIRHVLETIANFSGYKNIDVYLRDPMGGSKLAEDKGFSSMKVMMHDMSHGRYRGDVLSSDQIEEGCKAVCGFLNKVYVNQVNVARNRIT